MRSMPLNSKHSGWGRVDVGYFDLDRDPDDAAQLEDDLPFGPIGARAGEASARCSD